MSIVLLSRWLAGWLAGSFGAFVFRCLRVGVSLCLCALAWSLFKFRRWSIGQGRKIKKGPFPNVDHLRQSACHFLGFVFACVRLRPPCRQSIPKNGCRTMVRMPPCFLEIDITFDIGRPCRWGTCNVARQNVEAWQRTARRQEKHHAQTSAQKVRKQRLSHTHMLHHGGGASGARGVR